MRGKQSKNILTIGKISDGDILQDIELGKLIAVKEADHFSDRMTFGVPWHERRTEVEKVNGLMLINLNGDLWRRMRTMASPIFTSGKLKTMVPHINKVIVVMALQMH